MRSWQIIDGETALRPSQGPLRERITLLSEHRKIRRDAATSELINLELRLSLEC
jgi:hypothetical protein